MIQLFLSNERQQVSRMLDAGRLEVGRGPERDNPRIMVEDAYTSRDQLVMEGIDDERIQLTNLGGPIVFQSGNVLRSGETLVVALPVRMSFGQTTLDVATSEPVSELRTTLHPPQRPSVSSWKGSLKELGESPDAETLMEWFERLLFVQRAAAGSGEFYVETARAVVDLVGLDRGAIVIRQQDDWQVIAEHPPKAHAPLEVSRRILTHVLEDRQTYFESFTEGPLARSLAGVEAVVASPILDEQDQVVGVVYGIRATGSQVVRPIIKPLEAMVVQLLAAAVSAGLARLHQEAVASRNRVQFERFFSRELARALEQQPELLLGQQREITVLFTDVRGFTSIAEQLGPERTFHLLSELLDQLTHCVMEQGGVIIDYYGDGLAAMWNAPVDQLQHSRLACRAGLNMLALLPELNAAWQSALGVPLRIGIGIHRGLAFVGNSGSQHRLKYGPRGHTVNLASRLEAANKRLGTSLLVSGEVAGQLDGSFRRRHLGSVYLPGVREPVSLHELISDQEARDDWEQYCRCCDQLWLAFAERRLREAVELGTDLLDRFQSADQVTRLILEHAKAELEHPTTDFEPIVRLNGR